MSLILLLMHQVALLTAGSLLDDLKNFLQIGERSATCYSNYDCAFSYSCSNGICKRDTFGGIGPMRRQCPDNNCQNFWRCDWIEGACKIKSDGRCSNSDDCPKNFLCASFPDSKLSENSSKNGFCIPGTILDKFMRNNTSSIGPKCSPAPQNGQKCSGINGIYYVDN